MISPIKRKRRESGNSLFLGTAALVYIIPLMGLAIDTSFLYAVKGRLQAAVDGAALGAARALNIGETLQAQQTNASQNAVNWFYANFPPNTWATTGTVMSAASPTENDGSGYYSTSVNIYPDANNPQLDHVDLTASTKVPTWFMHWFGLTSTTLNVKSSATRRAAVVMMVLDRSGSMCAVNGVAGTQPCGKTSTGSACQAMIDAAKEFTGSFAAKRDYMGMVTFSSDTYVVPNSGGTNGIPDQNFQTTLGFTSTSGTGTGYIDNLECQGGTGTAQAIAMGYQLLVQTALPGALNILLIETDGLPNTVTMNFYDSTNNITALSSTSNCQDGSAAHHTIHDTPVAGFATSSVIPTWAPALSLTAAPFGTTSPSPTLYQNVPASMVGTVYSDDPGTGTSLASMFYPWTNWASQTQQLGTSQDEYYTNFTQYNATGCAFNNNSGGPGASNTNQQKSVSTTSDFSWFPLTDVYGSSFNPTNAYKSITTTSDSKGHSRLAINWTNYHNATLNAADNAAYNARANTTYPAYVFAVGLGNNSAGAPPDPILMQRIANDPDGDTFNSPAQYPACSTETGCITYASSTGQLQGTYVFAPTSNQLAQAFLQISSQILRLNK